MSHHFRRFLSTAVLGILLACFSMQPLAAPVYAKAVSSQASSFESGSSDLALLKDDDADSLRNHNESMGINRDLLQGDYLVRSGGKLRCKLSNGKYLKSGWRTFNGKTYYFNKKTYAMTGLQKIGNSYYIFNSKGVLQTKWIKYKKHWYYGSVKKNGRLLTRWQKIGGKRYYISVKTLYRLTGLQYIGKKHYYFNSKGVQQTADQVVKGKKIVFNSDGSVYSYGGRVLSKAAASGANTGNSKGVSKGQQVVDFALQFVGNPYKWGGSSLTHGCDCSGFVMAVYSHFGVQLPHYDAWIRQRGTAVRGGLAYARPGDVICYDGHVAIYMGGGRIVHAADYKYGICVWNNAAYRRILSIRRFF